MIGVKKKVEDRGRLGSDVAEAMADLLYYGDL